MTKSNADPWGAHRRSPGRTALTGDGERLYFGGTSYLGLHQNSQVKAALVSGIVRWGVGIGASRMTTGEACPYLDLERDLISWTHAKDALLTSSGWMANLCAAELLAARYPVTLLDAESHPSIGRAFAGLGRHPIIFSRSKGMAGIGQLVRTRAGRVQGPILLCTQAVSAATGEMTDLAALAQIVDEVGGGLWVDDAHGFGLLGRDGCGSVDHFGLSYQNVYVTTSLGKALGCAGGAVLCPRREAEARSMATYVTTTPLPPVLCLAIRAAIQQTRKTPALRNKVIRLGRYLRAGLTRLGIETVQTPIPVVAFSMGPRRDRVLARFAYDAGILLPWIRYPGGTTDGFFRLAVTALHTRGDIERVLKVIEKFGVRKEFP